MSRKIFALLSAGVVALSFFACDDDETTSSTQTTTQNMGGGGSGGDGGSGNAGGGGSSAECTVAGEPTADDCAGACELLFCCAEPRCDGLAAADEDIFRAGCEQTCAGMMATIAVVNGANCDTTVSTVRTVSASFANTCDNGLPMGGAGGTGGGGGGGSGGT